MEAGEIHRRVLAVCREVLRVDDLEIEDVHTAAEIPNYDSLAHIEILVRCQQEFGIVLSALEAGQVANFGELKGLVARKLSAG